MGKEFNKRNERVQAALGMLRFWGFVVLDVEILGGCSDGEGVYRGVWPADQDYS